MLKSKFFLLVSLAAIVSLACGCAKKASDAQLATNIKAQMFSDAQTKDSAVQVSVNDGVAKLTGTAPSDAAHLEAYKIATNTPGISKVDDEITVSSPEQSAQATPPAEAPAPAAEPAAKPAHRAHAVSRRERERQERAREEARKQAQEAAQESAQESAPPQDSNDASSAAATPPPTAPPTQAQPQPTQPPPPPPPPQPVNVQIPTGSVIHVQTIDTIDSATAQQGQEFQATLADPIRSNGQVIVPSGAHVAIRVAEVEDAGHFKGKSELQLQLARLTFQGAKYALSTDTYTLSGSSRGKNTAEKVGAGAVLGSIIGAIAGGGKGAAIGAGVGAAGGGVYQSATKAKSVRIPSETRLDFQLNQPLSLSYTPPASTNSSQ